MRWVMQTMHAKAGERKPDKENKMSHRGSGIMGSLG